VGSPKPPPAAPGDASRALAEVFLRDLDRFESAGKQLAQGNRSVDIPITGGSMGASLPDGTLVRVALGDGATCSAGDVVVFRQQEDIVAHRALARARDPRITRGDARLAPDQPVSFARVLGRVTGVVAGRITIEPPGMPRRRWPLQVADCCAIGIATLALQISPRLAGHWIQLLAWLESSLALLLGIARRHVPRARGTR
jgi:hypothetical protein